MRLIRSGLLAVAVLACVPAASLAAPPLKLCKPRVTGAHADASHSVALFGAKLNWSNIVRASYGKAFAYWGRALGRTQYCGKLVTSRTNYPIWRCRVRARPCRSIPSLRSRGVRTN